MPISDQEFLNAFKIVFNVLSTMLGEDVSLNVTDREKFICFKQAETFKLTIKEGDDIVKGGASDKVLQTGQRQVVRYPKEVFGAPIIVRSAPIINHDTGNILGTISFTVSQDKEQTVLEMAEELQTFTGELTTATEELAGAAQSLAASSQNINQAAKVAHDYFNKTGEILEYIRNVAETTNLLGLNAAIEAARAGEHGRGFSVVAEEIRKLARNSKSSAVEITGVLAKINDQLYNILETVNDFAAVSEEQSAQAQQIASGSQKLSEFSLKMKHLAENLM